MRFKNYLNDSYIGIVEGNPKTEIKDKKVLGLLKDLNRILQDKYKKKDLRFDVVEDYQSPTEVLADELDETRLERITRKWMRISEEFEDIKEEHLKTLQEE